MPHRPTASTWLTGAAIWLVAVVVLLRAVSPSTIRYDYQRAFYAAGTAVLEHQSLYASALHQLETKASSPSLSPYERAHTYIPYLYPPPYALFLAGLSAMPYEAAARVFYWINVAFLVLIALLIGYALGSRRRWFLASALVFAALVGFTPIRSTLNLGQADLVILVLATAGLAVSESLVVVPTSLKPWRSVVGGIFLGAAAVIKVYPGVILVLMLLRRQYRLVASALATVAVLMAVGVAVLGPGSFIDYLHASRLAAHPLVVAFPFAFGLMAFAYRALTATPYATPLIALPPALVGGAVVAVAVVLAALGIRYILTHERIDARHLFLAVAGALVFFPLLEPQHLALLMALLPGVVMVVLGGTDRMRKAGIPVAAAAIGASLILAWISLWAGDRATVVLTVLIALAVGAAAIVLSRRGQWPISLTWGSALISAGFVLLGSPALLQISGLWPVPLNRLDVLMGEAQLYALFVLIAGVLLVSLTKPRLR